MRELFIYYRVRPEHATGARAAVRGMQACLCERHPALRARLLQRPAEPAALQTWMEAYSADTAALPGGVDAALQAEIATASLALAAWIDGPRHTEVFVACAS